MCNEKIFYTPVFKKTGENSMNRQKVFPFTAIIGQEDMKKALLLNVINPKLGGVLIQGEKGTAKSTAVRALAELLPPRPCIGVIIFFIRFIRPVARIIGVIMKTLI